MPQRPAEVDDVFEVPLAFLMDPANHERQPRDWQGQQRYLLCMPWRERYIWGATAGMIRNLYRLITRSVDEQRRLRLATRLARASRHCSALSRRT